MAPTDKTKTHVIRAYVEPARQRGEKTVQVRVGNVLKELGWTNRTPSVFSTLSSQAFLRDAGLELIEKKGGPPSGGPSTTVQFLYRIKSESDSAVPVRGDSVASNSRGLEALLDLFGIFKEEYKALGGGDAYLQAERNAWGPDPWERLAIERTSVPSKIGEEK
ncbi:MAG TPA: hypothetical protein VHZ52_05665 [Acidobacteriaceae bacterium]|jgi:hypothetical protein|nr:hypothetical protein [Acidobacteriaceae bacterium]